MHPLTCYAGQISLCHAKIERISEKKFCHDQQGWGTQFLDFMGGDIEIMRVLPLGKTLLYLNKTWHTTRRAQMRPRNYQLTLVKVLTGLKNRNV